MKNFSTISEIYEVNLSTIWQSFICRKNDFLLCLCEGIFFVDKNCFMRYQSINGNVKIMEIFHFLPRNGWLALNSFTLQTTVKSFALNSLVPEVVKIFYDKNNLLSAQKKC